MADTLYTARFELPDLLQVGRDNVAVCRVYRAGALVTPSSGTVTLIDPGGTAIVDAEDVTIAASVAKLTFTTAHLVGQQPSSGWSIEWALTMPDTVTHTFRNAAFLVRRQLYPVVTEADLYRVASSLDPAGSACIHSETSFVDKLDEAFVELQGRLIAKGNRPNLILEPSALRMVHLKLTLALIFEDFSSRLNAAYAEQAREYRAQYQAAWDEMTFPYDTTDSGRPADGTRGGRRGPARTLWLMGR